MEICTMLLLRVSQGVHSASGSEVNPEGGEPD